MDPNSRSFALEGRHVRLEPLGARHHPGLCAIAFDPALWTYIPSAISTPGDVTQLIGDAENERARGVSVPFATVWRDGDRVIGSTRFMNIDLHHRRVEIGWTFLAAPWQRTATNTEAKLLMLRHAFEVWRCERVELKTHAHNERSRAAIRRIGGVEEGILRSHMTMHTGPRRDTVYYSILAAEWPAARERLETRLR